MVHERLAAAIRDFIWDVSQNEHDFVYVANIENGEILERDIYRVFEQQASIQDPTDDEEGEQ